MLILKELTFDSAHYLPELPEDHKCRHIHGHTYRLKVWLEGKPDEIGWVMDFADLKKSLMPVIDTIDHKILNHIEGLENPTCELVAVWLWKKLKPTLSSLKRIELYETPTSGVLYEGENIN
jgi:6-pyruvoyltetrahydropterin/6-carboxytetrahydropterin synthase